MKNRNTSIVFCYILGMMLMMLLSVDASDHHSLIVYLKNPALRVLIRNRLRGYGMDKNELRITEPMVLPKGDGKEDYIISIIQTDNRPKALKAKRPFKPIISLRQILKDLIKSGMVDHVYIKRRSSVALIDPLPIDQFANRIDTNLEDQQTYIKENKFLKRLKGTNVQVGVIGGDWNGQHDSIAYRSWDIKNGRSVEDPIWQNHGTAILSMLAGQKGVQGLIPEADISLWSIEDGTALAIFKAAQTLRPGSILLLTTHTTLPGKKKIVVPEEYYPAVQRAIQFAVKKGLVVLSFAGHGAFDLNQTLQRGKKAFPKEWNDNLSKPWSILIGTQSQGVLDPHTNRGEGVDIYTQGRGIVAAGYGDLSGTNDNNAYTARFSGAASVTLAAAALAQVQSGLTARRLPLLNQDEARSLLRHFSGEDRTKLNVRKLFRNLNKKCPYRQSRLIWKCVKEDGTIDPIQNVQRRRRNRRKNRLHGKQGKRDGKEHSFRQRRFHGKRDGKEHGRFHGKREGHNRFESNDSLGNIHPMEPHRIQTRKDIQQDFSINQQHFQLSILKELMSMQPSIKAHPFPSPSTCDLFRDTITTLENGLNSQFLAYKRLSHLSIEAKTYIQSQHELNNHLRHLIALLKKQCTPLSSNVSSLLHHSL